MGPAWSPDGAWIAYHSQVDAYRGLGEPGMGLEMEILGIRPDGTDDRRITADDVEDSFPAWSPDGRYCSADAAADPEARLPVGPADRSVTAAPRAHASLAQHPHSCLRRRAVLG